MDEKDEIIIEFIAKTQGLAYQNNHGVCLFCGGGRIEDDKGSWIPLHQDHCLYSRAGALVCPVEENRRLNM